MCSTLRPALVEARYTGTVVAAALFINRSGVCYLKETYSGSITVGNPAPHEVSLALQVLPRSCFGSVDILATTIRIRSHRFSGIIVLLLR